METFCDRSLCFYSVLSCEFSYLHVQKAMWCIYTSEMELKKYIPKNVGFRMEGF